MSMRASHNDRWTLKGNFLKEKDEARRIAANVAKLPSQLRNSDTPGAIQTNSSGRRRG